MDEAEDQKSEPDVFVLEVTQEQYEERLKRGWTDDDMLKAGRYKLKRGGFLARHPEINLIDKRSG